MLFFFCISATTIVAFFPGLARRGSDNSSVSGLSSNGPSLKNRPKNIGDQMKEKLRACEMCNVRHGEKNTRATGYFRITFHVIRLNHVTQAGHEPCSPSHHPLDLAVTPQLYSTLNVQHSSLFRSDCRRTLTTGNKGLVLLI